MRVELFLAKQCGSAKHDFKDASLYFTLRSVYCSGNRMQFAGLLVRQSHSIYAEYYWSPFFGALCTEKPYSHPLCTESAGLGATARELVDFG